MKDKSLTQHYQQILGDTSPWDVSEVRLDSAFDQRGAFDGAAGGDLGLPAVSGSDACEGVADASLASSG